MRWWGWGDPAHQAELPAEGLAALRAELRVSERSVPPVALEDVRLTEPVIAGRALERLRDTLSLIHI